ncbi:MAG: sigma-54-dependent Fis family transcriptional regulator [Planctomycetes bacterium]|nr:sigma-54-dependent Fis family transcriptional regulator [Planctomycetota bacterium]
MGQLLIVDDDEHILQAVAERFTALGHEVSTATSGREALSKIRRDRPDLVLLDLQLPDGDGLSVLAELRQDGLEVTVVVLTAYGTVERAVQAMKSGAYDFIQKPFETALVEETVKRALERSALQRECSALRMARVECEPVAEDPRTREAFAFAARAARSAATVLLLGESGTGKEVVARELHRLSPRARGPLVAVNCAALTETLLESELFGHEKGAFTGAAARRIGRIEAAHRGTLFLDEVGDIPPSFQVKLLRVLQERAFERVGGNAPITVDTRVVAATNRDLKALVGEGKFREDLFYRLNVLSLRLPPLRERRADIRPLVVRFLEDSCREAHRAVPRVSEEAFGLLEAHAWPGNVRELKNVVERTVCLLDGEEIAAHDLPEELRGAPGAAGASEPADGFHVKVHEYRRGLLREALERAGGNQTKAAEALGLQRTYLARLIRQFGL